MKLSVGGLILIHGATACVAAAVAKCKRTNVSYRAREKVKCVPLYVAKIGRVGMIDHRGLCKIMFGRIRTR